MAAGLGTEPLRPDEAGSSAERLRRLRDRLGLSQEQLARRLGVSFATVNRWESGRTRMSERASRALADFEARTEQPEAGAPPEADGQPEAGGQPEADGQPEAGGQPGRREPPRSRQEKPRGRPAMPGSDRPIQAVQPAAPLPVGQSSFVGRERELAELSQLLASSRLVSVTGPGGAGKTRLAIEAVRRWKPAAEVVFIPLEPVRQPQSLISVVASGVRVRDEPGVPIQASVEAALAASPRVIILDGAERLRDDVARLAMSLLAAAEGVQIIVTSRMVLGISGEVCWAVPPLECPSATAGASEIASSDAVRLFMARAAERLPAFTSADVAPHAVAELCRKLDGLPLAIELMAGWVGTLSIREILQDRAILLDQEPAADGQPGSRRLVDVVRASYDLLRPEQQRLLRALSVFAGPFTVDDARAISADGAPAAARLIRALVDSSWLLVSRGADYNRFSLLETMRTFAEARLDEQENAAGVRRQHARYFAELAAASEAGLAGPDAARWTARLEAAMADLDVALRWADEADEISLGLEMGAGLWRWWLFSGRLGHGRGWLARFLARAAQRRDELTGRALASAAVLAAENGDYAAAVQHAQLALVIFEPLGLRERMAFAATVLGSAQRYLGDRAVARRSFQSAMDLRAALGDRRGVSAAMNNMALLELDDGDLARARELFEQALMIKRQLGDQRSLAIGLANLSEVLIRTGQLDAAHRALAEAAELAAELGNPQLVGTIHCNQGDLAARRLHWEQAAGHYRAAVLAHEEAGHANDVAAARIGLGRACYRLGRLEEAVRHLRGAEALAGEISNPQRLADARSALAEAGEGPAGPPPGGLTARQAEVLCLLAAGLSNKEIAAELYLSPATVERHLATIYRRLGLSGRVEATRYAVTQGLAGQTR